MKNLMNAQRTPVIAEKLGNIRFNIGATAYRQVKSHWNPMHKTPPFTALRIPVNRECGVFDSIESVESDWDRSFKSAFRKAKQTPS